MPPAAMPARSARRSCVVQQRFPAAPQDIGEAIFAAADDDGSGSV